MEDSCKPTDSKEGYREDRVVANNKGDNMAKFVVVNSAPEKLEKGEVVITQPTFLEQIRENSRKAPKNKQTGINHLREIVQAVSLKYDQELNVFKIPMHKYEGVPFANETDLSNIVVNMLKTEYPTVFDKYIEHELKNRPINTKLVYFVGNFTETSAFYKMGLDLIELKDVESYMTGKPKKVVGKPAVTKEEVENG